jgi:hypothetical protein
VPEGSVVGRIIVRAEDLFDLEDPREDRRLFRLANRLHRATRVDAIRRQLLFHSGDPYSEVLVAESERALREKDYIYDSRVRPVAVHDGVVDVEVVTRDVWTSNLGVSFGTAGGKSKTAFKIEDSNLLGTGKGLRLEHRSDVDRTSDALAYTDPNVGGSRVRLDALLENNSDGSARLLLLEKPFESLQSHWAAGALVSTADRVDPIYSLGRVTNRFRHRASLFELSGGLSKGLRGHRSLRWKAGLTYQRDLFEPAPEWPTSSFLPTDRTLVYPWVGFDYSTDAFAKTRNLDNIDRTEDLYLGRRFHGRLGYASSSLGSSLSAAVFDGSGDIGWRLSERQHLLVGGGIAGRWGASGPENLLVETRTAYYLRNFERHLFVASLEATVADELDLERQILLGGDSGLRGYPLRYQAGEASLLFSLEQRFFTDWYPWRLFHVGAAVFFDAGRTWGEDAFATPNLGLLKDVGVGLRLGSSRSSGSVVHIDVAFPLDRDPSIRSFQLLIRSKQTL